MTIWLRWGCSSCVREQKEGRRKEGERREPRNERIEKLHRNLGRSYFHWFLCLTLTAHSYEGCSEDILQWEQKKLEIRRDSFTWKSILELAVTLTLPTRRRPRCVHLPLILTTHRNPLIEQRSSLRNVGELRATELVSGCDKGNESRSSTIWERG